MKNNSLNTIEKIWKPIENCNYMISNMGEVIDKNTNKPVELYKSTNGYVYIYLKLGSDDTNKLYPIHHILATIFIDKLDPCLPNTRALFKDVKRGCCVDNIYWGIEKEIWKPLPQIGDIIPNRYKISNFGNVYDMKKSCVLKTYVNPNGYKIVYLKTIGIKTTNPFKLHRFIAMAFCDKIDESHNIVNHIDGNKLNNHYTNLEWVTQKMNLKHSYTLGLSHVGEDLYNAKMTNTEAEKICKLLVDNNFSHINVFEIIKNENTNITIDMVKSIKEKHSWKHISDLYFTANDYKKRTRMGEETVHEICKMFVDNDLDLITVYNMVKDRDISYDAVSKIKYKKNWKHISDLYF